MSQKQDKKVRKMFRKEIRGTVQRLTEEMYDAGELFLSKPKWCPTWLWEKLKALVVNPYFKFNYDELKKKLAKENSEGKATEEGGVTSGQ